MAAMLMVLIYNLADTFFIGQTHDDLQVAAVSLATPIFLLFMSLGTVFGIGGTSVISRALGEGRKDYAKKVCSFCMWSCVGVGILMSALFLLFMNPILSLIGASTETWVYAKTYLTIVSCSGPFVLIANCYSNVIRAEGQSGKAMMGQLLGNLLNVILNPIMILVLHWNITGAAIATVIGNVVGAGYYILYFLKELGAVQESALRFSLQFAFALSVVLTALCYLFTGQIVSAFLTDAAAYDYGFAFSRILPCTSFLFGVFYVLINALQACGAATESFIVNISRQGLIYIPAMFILGSIFHETGLIWAQPVADVLSFLLAVVLYRRISVKMNRSL